MDERRRHSRHAIAVTARVASAAEQQLPSAQTVDISFGGLLLAFDEPIGFPVGHRLVVSLDLAGGHLHAIADVTRIERGIDFRTYIALEFSQLREDEFEAVIEHLRDAGAADTGRSQMPS